MIGFIGRVNFAPQDYHTPDVWRLEEPFAQLTCDGFVIVCEPWVATDGASIPRVLWPVVGHPFHGANKIWSQPHDQGYNGQAVVYRVSDLPIDPAKLLDRENDQYIYLRYMSQHVEIRRRKWWDKRMVEAMRLCGERWLKRFIVMRGVRAGGWVSWRSNHK